MDNVEKNYKIAFISDLHFDNISENTDNGISFLEAEEKKAEFIACLKRYFNDYIVCIKRCLILLRNWNKTKYMDFLY